MLDSSSNSHLGYIKTIFPKLILIYGAFFCWLSVNSTFGTHTAFSFLYLFSLVFFIPKKVISPVNILMIYYGVWFVLAPMYGSGYRPELLASYEYKMSMAMVSSTYVTALLAILFGSFVAEKIKLERLSDDALPKNDVSVLMTLYFFATLFVFLIIQSSGGLAVWISNPGDAFLNRSGSGVFVILSHFSSIALAGLTGYYAYNKKKKFPLYCFISWLLLTSPVHGSKFQISLLLIVSLLPWLKNMRTTSPKSIMLGVTLVIIFVTGMIFRGFNAEDPEKLLSLFNYFSTLHNLAISVRDFEPGSLSTFFLPFNKFLTPFGLSGAVTYFDMNHLLTDIYYPEAWEIRATEQWPVETDLYLNFYYFGGLPLLVIYMFTIGFIYQLAQKFSSLGLLMMSALLTLFMLSHLRGSLYNHTDFYMVPYMIIIAAVFYRHKIR